MKIPRIPIRAADYDGTLRWCNKLKREHGGGKPWKRMPAGRVAISSECPCSKAVAGLRVGPNVFQFDTGAGAPLPAVVRRFVAAFDAGAINETLALPVRGLRARKRSRP